MGVFAYFGAAIKDGKAFQLSEVSKPVPCAFCTVHFASRGKVLGSTGLENLQVGSQDHQYFQSINNLSIKSGLLPNF